jgi:hypothetical protein
MHGEEPKFAPKTTSMKALSEIWQERAQHPDVMADLAYWRSQDWKKFKPLPPESHPGQLAPDHGIAHPHAIVEFLSEDETVRIEKTAAAFPELSLNDIVTCAVVFAYGTWTGSRALSMIGGQNGRTLDFDDRVDLSRTVGWCMHYTRLPLDLTECRTVLEALHLVKQGHQRLRNREAHYALLRFMSDDEAIRNEMESFSDAQLEFGFIPPYVVAQKEKQSTAFRIAPEFRGMNEGDMRSKFRPFGASAIHEGKLGVFWTYCQCMYTEATFRSFVKQVLDSVREIARELDDVIQDGTLAGKALHDSTTPDVSYGAE